MTRHAILGAALDLFAEQGYEGTSLEEIGRVANVTGTAIYRHFDGKEDLLIAAFEYAGRDRFAALEASQGLPPDQALELLLESFAAFTFDVPQWTKLWLLERGGQFPVKFNQATSAQQKRYFGRWVDVVANLRPELSRPACRELIHIVWSMMNGAVYYKGELGRERRIAVLIDSARRVLLSGGVLSQGRR